MECTAFNHAARNSLHSFGIHCATMHGIHCVQSKSIAPHCMESTAFSRDPLGHAASNPLHSIGIHLTTLHGMHFVQLGCILPCCMESTAFNDTAWNPLHHSGRILPCSMESTAFSDAAWNPLQSIGIHCATLQGNHCIQSTSIAPCCMESTAFNWDSLGLTAWNTLRSIEIH